MNQIFSPEKNKVHIFKQYGVMYIPNGLVHFQADFKNYQFKGPSVFFFAPGQYFKWIGGKEGLVIIEFVGFDYEAFANARLLFVHLVSLGHVSLAQTPANSLKNVFQDPSSIRFEPLLQNAVDTWLEANPFGATPIELSILFDAKTVFDQTKARDLRIEKIADKLSISTAQLNKITNTKLNLSLTKMKSNKVLLEV